MRNSVSRVGLLLLLAGYTPAAAFIARGRNQPAALQTRQEARVTDARLSRLPLRLRSEGLTLLKETDDTKLAQLANTLVVKDPAAAIPFLISVLDTDRSARVRRVMINVLGKYSRPEVRRAFEHHAASDADAGVALLALEKVRFQETRETSKLLLQRMEMARQSGDEESFRRLAQEHERWVSLIRGTMLPAFLRTVPPAFSLKPAEQAVRVLAFGDFGNGSAEQKQVAGAMLRHHHQVPFDFALTLGDNFYNLGMESPNDPRWRTWWAALYDPFGIKFYATFGNHDWGFADSPAAEILYTERSQSWRLPAPYYTFTAGPVQFYALDTNEISEAQRLWLKDELEKSNTHWKLVYGHHPIYSAGTHGDSDVLMRKLLPVLKEHADIYLAGHDHDLQHLKPEGGVHFFISGGGGAGLRPPKPKLRSLFARGIHGFTVLEADMTQFKVSFIGADGVLLYMYALTK